MKGRAGKGERGRKEMKVGLSLNLVDSASKPLAATVHRKPASSWIQQECS